MHINTAKAEFSMLRPWMATFRGISKEKLYLYICHYEFLRNHRELHTDLPKKERFSLFHLKTWSKKYRKEIYEPFKGLAKAYKNVYYPDKNYPGKIPLYALEPQKWQGAWTTKIKEKRIQSFVRKYIRVKENSRINLFHNDIKEVLPYLRASKELVKRSGELSDHYFQSNPQKH